MTSVWAYGSDGDTHTHHQTVQHTDDQTDVSIVSALIDPDSFMEGPTMALFKIEQSLTMEMEELPRREKIEQGVPCC
jgi:hypothetical protein